MKLAYLDCFSGISGDMVLGALLDIGLPPDVLLREFEKLPLEGYTVHTAREMRGAISGMRIRIDIEEQPPRAYSKIRELIAGSELEAPVREKSLAVFDKLAAAESRVHQVGIDDIHFHEVGAVDSILDIVGAVFGFRYLGIDRIGTSRVPLGHGFVRTQHGLLPVPAPATALLLEGLPVCDGGAERELVTPTGAALLSTLAEFHGCAPEMVLQSVGYGVGSNPSADPPNVLRVFCGTSIEPVTKKTLVLVETSIDDMNPEFYNHMMERMFGIGVLDVNLVPIQMKKNRPGVLVRALMEPSLQTQAVEIIFRETSSLGVRIQEVERIELPRKIVEIMTSYGPCRVKRVTMPGGEERGVPEYEDCRRIALDRGIPIGRVYEEVLFAARGADVSPRL